MKGKTRLRFEKVEARLALLESEAPPGELRIPRHVAEAVLAGLKANPPGPAAGSEDFSGVPFAHMVVDDGAVEAALDSFYGRPLRDYLDVERDRMRDALIAGIEYEVIERPAMRDREGDVDDHNAGIGPGPPAAEVTRGLGVDLSTVTMVDILCPACNGEGEVKTIHKFGQGWETEPCVACGGSGKAARPVAMMGGALRAVASAEALSAERDAYRSDKKAVEELYDNLLTTWAESRARHLAAEQRAEQAERERDEARADRGREKPAAVREAEAAGAAAAAARRVRAWLVDAFAGYDCQNMAVFHRRAEHYEAGIASGNDPLIARP